MTSSCVVALCVFIDDSLLKSKANKEVIQPLSQRVAVARQFLELFKPGLEYYIVPITDVAGPTGWDPNVQALVVSKETLNGAAASMCLSFGLSSL
jgi:pantetheine-phosphate adenylyltransferase